MANSDWDIEIRPNRGLLNLGLAEVWHYRDLLLMLVKRDFVTYYKQTILGPLWFFIQPILMTLMFTVIFGNVAGLSTDGLPKILFYLSGVTAWAYFADCLTKTATTFRDNQQVFGKVYFPRLVAPLSIVISNLIKFGIQFLLFIVVLLFQWAQGAPITPNVNILLLPVLVLLMALLALGLGMIITSLTTKYRDLVFLLTFAVQLLMYATPVIYPMSSIPADYRTILALNPMSPIIESFRFAFLGVGDHSLNGLLFATTAALVLVGVGAIMFTRTEKNFMDTV